MAGRVAVALNSACAAFTSNPRRLHGSGNQSPQVINCKGHKTSFFFFGSSSPRQPGLLSKNSHAATPPHKRRRHPLPAPGQHPTGWHGEGGGLAWWERGLGSVPVPGFSSQQLSVSFYKRQNPPLGRAELLRAMAKYPRYPPGLFFESEEGEEG